LTLTILAIGASTAAATVYTYISVSVSSTGSYTTGQYYDTNVPYPQPPPVHAISIVHNGAVVATQSSGGTGYVYMTSAPAVGDTVRIEQPPGTVVDSIVFNLTIDPSTCVGRTTISGQRSDVGAHVSAYAFDPNQGGYGNYLQGQITSLSGSSYAGNFSRALTSSDHVGVVEGVSFNRGYGPFSYDGSLERAVGACPPPPALPVKVTGPKPPKGSISVNAKRALRAFFKKGLTIVVSADQPGKVVENMFLAKGKLPGKASSVQAAKRKSKQRKASLIGRGSAKVLKPGKVKVTVKPTRSAKRLRRKRSLKVAFLTTLSNLAGQTTTLPPKRVKLTR
jgi:hypothetical protein